MRKSEDVLNTRDICNYSLLELPSEISLLI